MMMKKEQPIQKGNSFDYLEPQSKKEINSWLITGLSKYIQQMNGRGKGNLYSIVIQGVEKPLINIVLEATKGNQAQAAELLGINRNTLRKKIKLLGIKTK